MAKKIKHQQRIPTPQKPKPLPGAKKFSFAAPTDKKRVLHIGWGSALSASLHNRFKGDDWQEIRLDPDASAKPDILSPLSSMKDVPDHSVDAVWAQHVLQRFPGPEIPLILKECKRVLKPLGYMLLSVPDGQAAAAYIANSRADEVLFQTPLGGVTPVDLICGFRLHLQRGLSNHHHRFVFTGELLGTILRDAGFTNIRVQRRATFDILAVGYDYPYDHPERVERIEVMQEASKDIPAAPAIKAAAPLQVPIPGLQLKGARGLTDELDIAPGQWKPLGLKK